MEKITLNYSASGQKLKPLYSLKKFASDTVNYVVAVFDLDKSWAFDSVRAVWKTENACISTVLDQDGACTVPQEVLQKKAKVEVNLVGSDVEENQLTDRLTTYPVQAFIVDRDVPICGSETAEITPSQFEQFVQIVTAEVAKIRDVDRVELNDDYTITFYYSDGTESPKIGPIRGETGADGNGIQNITKIGSEGRIDTYRIIYTNGGHFDFNVTNGEKGDRGVQGETGNGIDRIEKTATVGSVDTYTIYFTDGSTTTFTVTNGEVTKSELEELLPTESASGSIVSFLDGQSVFPMKSLKVNLEPIQDLSHGDPSPSNICPISGWDEVETNVTGVNVWDEEYLNGYYSSSGTFVSNSKQLCSKNMIRVLPDTSYYFKLGNFSGNQGQAVCFYDANKNFLSRTLNIYNFTTPSDCCYININIGSNYGATYNHDISINYPSTDHDYHAYQGRTITTTLPQTVYGGTLDVVSGVLTVDRAMVDFGTLNWTYVSGGSYFYAVISNKAKGFDNIVCSAYETAPRAGVENLQDGQIVGGMNDTAVYIKDSRYTDATAFKTAMNGVQLCYELATPQTYQLTPQEVQTLLGQNNVWSEQGDVDVTYKADIQLYIDKKTNELAVAIAAL